MLRSLTQRVLYKGETGTRMFSKTPFLVRLKRRPDEWARRTCCLPSHISSGVPAYQVAPSNSWQLQRLGKKCKHSNRICLPIATQHFGSFIVSRTSPPLTMEMHSSPTRRFCMYRDSNHSRNSFDAIINILKCCLLLPATF